MAGLELRTARITLGLTQTELAVLLDVTTELIFLYENEKLAIDTRTAYALRYVLNEVREGHLWPGAQLPEVPSFVIRSWRYRLAHWLLRGIKYRKR